MANLKNKKERSGLFMKHIKHLVLVAVFISFLAVFLFSSLGITAEYTLRYGHIQTVNHPNQKAALYFAEKMAQATNNRVEIKIFPAGQLGGEREMIESIQLGTLEMGMISSGLSSNIEPKMAVFELPFIYRSTEHFMKVADGPIGQMIVDSLLTKGIRLLGFGDLGFRQTTSNKAIRKPEDFIGLKIRLGESPLPIATFKQLGANVHTLAFSEVYLALKQGTVDAQENPLTVINATKLYEVQKYISLTGHMYTTMIIQINEKLFQKLPKDIQKNIVELGKDTAKYHRKLIKEDNDNLLNQLKKYMEVIQVDRNSFAEKTKPVIPKFSDKVGGQKIVDEVIATGE